MDILLFISIFDYKQCLLYKGIYNILYINNNQFVKYVNPWVSWYPYPSTICNLTVTTHHSWIIIIMATILILNGNLNFLVLFSLKYCQYSWFVPKKFFCSWITLFIIIFNSATFLDVTFCLIKIDTIGNMLIFQNNCISLFSYGFLISIDLTFTSIVINSRTFINTEISVRLSQSYWLYHAICLFQIVFSFIYIH